MPVVARRKTRLRKAPIMEYQGKRNRKPWRLNKHLNNQYPKFPNPMKTSQIPDPLLKTPIYLYFAHMSRRCSTGDYSISKFLLR